ncbi:MAG: hypothetical protein H7123_07440 [Thermoleophilia bacterium]|nr:hypothetical protein [Thermoleophilia bacterium]
MIASSFGHRGRTLLLTLIATFAVVAIFASSAQAQSRDHNRDGIPDRWETKMHLSLRVSQAGRDQDHDGVTNVWEYRLHMSARDADSNDDGVSDGQTDADGDGLNNADEVLCHEAPNDTDSDNDGTIDGQEDTDSDGIPNAAEEPLDDSPADADSDDDGVSDGAEDSDGAGTDDASEIDNGTNPEDAGDDSNGDTEADDSGAADDEACGCDDYSGFVLSFDGSTMRFETWGGQIVTVYISASFGSETWSADGSYTHTMTSMQLYSPGTVLHDLQVDPSGVADSAQVTIDS